MTRVTPPLGAYGGDAGVEAGLRERAKTQSSRLMLAHLSLPAGGSPPRRHPPTPPLSELRQSQPLLAPLRAGVPPPRPAGLPACQASCEPLAGSAGHSVVRVAC